MPELQTDSLLDLLAGRGREIIAQHLDLCRGCVKVARVISLLCTALSLPCEVHSVIAVVRNHKAHELDLWPPVIPQNTDLSEARCYFVGDLPYIPDMRLHGLLNAHVVPVVDGELVDMTLARDVAQSLPTIVAPMPGLMEKVRLDLFDTHGVEVIYIRSRRPLNVESLPYWKTPGVNTHNAVQELLDAF